MSYEVKKRFTALDLRVGDLMYDAEEDTMVKVIFVGEATIKDIAIISLRGGNAGITKDTFRQVVIEDTESKMISVLDVFGKQGEMPKMENGKPRFRHLMKSQSTTLTGWSTPSYPWYPYCPSYPNYPYTWCGTTTLTGLTSGSLTTTDATTNYNLSSTNYSVNGLTSNATVTLTDSPNLSTTASTANFKLGNK